MRIVVTILAGASPALALWALGNALPDSRGGWISVGSSQDWGLMLARWVAVLGGAIGLLVAACRGGLASGCGLGALGGLAAFVVLGFVPFLGLILLGAGMVSGVLAGLAGSFFPVNSSGGAWPGGPA